MSLWERFREWMGWHKPDSFPHLAPMSISPESRCRYCGRRILQDSQGGWFLA